MTPKDPKKKKDNVIDSLSKLINQPIEPKDTRGDADTNQAEDDKDEPNQTG